jgi:sec-independent protein translocase protein TatA
MGFISAPGPLEMMVILVVALLVLGPQRLPEVARSVGKGMRELKDSLSGIGDDDYADADELEDLRARAGVAYQKEPVSRTPSASSCSIVFE